MYAFPESTNAAISSSVVHKLVSMFIAVFFSSVPHNVFIARSFIEKNLGKEVIS